MLEQEIATAVVDLWPDLSPRQREMVDDVIAGFGAVDSDSSRRLLLRFLKQAKEHPERVGFHPGMSAHGCSEGFRIIDESGPSTVERCRICSPDYQRSEIPESPYA